MNDRIAILDASTFAERIRILRAQLARNGLAAMLFPSADPHLSEYLPERWQGRRWLSGAHRLGRHARRHGGFRGRVGRQLLLDAGRRAACGHRHPVDEDDRRPAIAPHVDWLARNVQLGGIVAVDGAVLGVAAACALTDALKARGIAPRTDIDVLDAVWPERPSLLDAPVYEHAAPHASVPRANKLAQVRAAMREKGAQWPVALRLDARRSGVDLQSARRRARRVLRAGAGRARRIAR